MKSINEIRNYFLEEIEQNKLMSKKHKKVCTTLNYIKHVHSLASTITGYISISAFISLFVVPIGITSSAVQIRAIAAGIVKYKSIINKTEKHDLILLLTKSKLNRMEVLISKALIDSNISHDEFVSINDVLKEYEMKKEIKNLKT